VTIRGDVVEFVGHAAGLGDIADGARAVELGSDDIVHHTVGDKLVTVNEASENTNLPSGHQPCHRQQWDR
jgi:hypothetical protein